MQITFTSYFFICLAMFLLMLADCPDLCKGSVNVHNCTVVNPLTWARPASSFVQYCSLGHFLTAVVQSAHTCVNRWNFWSQSPSTLFNHPHTRPQHLSFYEVLARCSYSLGMAGYCMTPQLYIFDNRLWSLLIPCIKACGSLSFGWTAAGPDICSQLQSGPTDGTGDKPKSALSKTQAEAPNGLCLANIQLIRPRLPI